jgi:glycine cleavage system aminomethyltransferase T
VITEESTIACEVIIIAAGLWSGDLARSCGLSLPLHALEHQYLITKPFGVARDLPLFLSYDDQLYGREETGGLIVGSLDDNAIPVATADLPRDASYCLLNERWDQFEPYLATAMRRFPALRIAGVKMLLNGPESFTPDGQMLLGPIPGATGVYAACGFNSNGMALAPAAGRFIAEWIVEGAASADVTALDVRRFSAVQATKYFIRERVTEIPGYHCRLSAPDADYQTARGIRRSPLHESLAAAGGHFASINGWERALWCDQGDADSAWADAVALEFGGAMQDVLVVDRSADTKLLLTGRGAGAWLDVAAPALLNGRALTGDSEVGHRLLPGDFGQIEAYARVLLSDPNRCLMTVSPDQDARLREWLRRAELPASVQTLDLTAAYACLEFSGPRRTALMDALTEAAEIKATGAGVAVNRLAGSAAVEMREDSVNDTTLLTIPSDCAHYVWERLIASAATFALKVGGHFAQEAIRISRGVPAFGREMTPAMLAHQFCAARRAAATRTFIAAPQTHRLRVLAAFSSTMTSLGFGPREVILGAGGAVGELTSGVRLPGWSRTLSLGLLDPEHWQGGSVDVVTEGRRWQLDPRPTSWGSAIQEMST